MERSCETCMYYDYDAEEDTSACMQALDEDEWYAYCADGKCRCPYYRPDEGDEGYVLARRQ